MNLYKNVSKTRVILKRPKYMGLDPGAVFDADELEGGDKGNDVEYFTVRGFLEQVSKVRETPRRTKTRPVKVTTTKAKLGTAKNIGGGAVVMSVKEEVEIEDPKPKPPSLVHDKGMITVNAPEKEPETPPVKNIQPPPNLPQPVLQAFEEAKKAQEKARGKATQTKAKAKIKVADKLDDIIDTTVVKPKATKAKKKATK